MARVEEPSALPHSGIRARTEVVSQDSLEGTGASRESLHEMTWGKFSQPGLDRSVCPSFKKNKKTKNRSSNTIEFSNFSCQDRSNIAVTI